MAENIKELVVNGEILARYIVEGQRLYLKVDVYVIKGESNIYDCEKLCWQLIEHIEKRGFYMVSHLNI